MENIIIFGASGHGSVVADCVERSGGYRIVGFVDSFKGKGMVHHGYPVLGSEYDLPFVISKFNVKGGIVAIGDNWCRKGMVDRILRIDPNFNFVMVVHPKAVMSNNAVIGPGSVVMPGAVVNAGAVVGEHCILNTNVSLGHDGVMDNFSSLAPRVATGGNLFLGRFSAVGLGSSIIENIEIGEHTVIGAGSLVVGNVPSYVVAYGSPAKLVRSRSVGERYLGRNAQNLHIMR
ncbi:acetyltransferase [Maribacter sp. 2307ULW6-5]|uniref:acetyltransferase n=1 Tax=Maribacter sp. 2307ULW6-5 TaxID=3386275 RepID=UPI0039BD31BE